MAKEITPEQEDMELERFFTLINLDEAFSQNPNARILNNDTLISKKLSTEFTDAIYSSCDGDLGFAPTCKCGAVHGATKLGLYCPLCDSTCEEQFIDHLEQQAWLGIPDCMSPVLHPIWYLILKNWTSVGKASLSILDIILDPEKDVPEDFIPYLNGRGFKYFYENADKILDILIYQYPKTAKKPNTRWIIEFRKKYRDMMFTKHLPILHNSLHPLKNNGGTLNYVDSESKEALQAVINLSNETYKHHAITVTDKQWNKAIYDIYESMINYYTSIYDEKLGGKTALLRKHCFGSRVHFSFRSVIVPHSVVLDLDEIVLPWGIMVNTFKLMILNILIHRKKMLLADALELYISSLTKYDPIIDECLQTIVHEFPLHKIPILLGRNPELFGRLVSNS